MAPPVIFLLVVVAVVVVVAALAFTGVLGSLTGRRRERSGDRELGAGEEDSSKPPVKGPVPEQEEREKGTLFPPAR